MWTTEEATIIIKRSMQDLAKNPDDYAARHRLCDGIICLQRQYPPIESRLPHADDPEMPCIYCGALWQPAGEPFPGNMMEHSGGCPAELYLGQHHASVDIMWHIVEQLRVRQFVANGG